MDSNTFLLGWAFLATCSIGYYQAKLLKLRRHSRAITFALCEVASGDLVPKREGKFYIIETDEIHFSFRRRQDE